jgi:hypothetical protein
MTDNDAYDEGYDAYWDGIKCEDNPYDQEKEPKGRRRASVGRSGIGVDSLDCMWASS